MIFILVEMYNYLLKKKIVHDILIN
jgi:hypothetical protein